MTAAWGACVKQGMISKRTSVNIDPRIVADAKIALWEAQRAGLADSPKNLTDMLATALRKEIEHLRSRAREATAQGVIGGP